MIRSGARAPRRYRRERVSRAAEDEREVRIAADAVGAGIAGEDLEAPQRREPVLGRIQQRAHLYAIDLDRRVALRQLDRNLPACNRRP
jgi:hypothetical protein